MYNFQLQNRKKRLHQNNIDVNSLPSSLKLLFGSSFLDGFKIEYTPQDFTELQWDPSLAAETSWEQDFAS